MKRIKGVVCLFAALLLASSFLRAADYMGAAAVLEKISAKPAAKTNGQNLSASLVLKRDIETFNKQSASLQPDEAAQQWLKLLDRQLTLEPEENGLRYEMSQSAGSLYPAEIWGALPPPSAWDALRKDVDARPLPKDEKSSIELCLRLIVHTLVADRSAQTNDLAQLEAVAAKSPESGGGRLSEICSQLSESLLEKSGNPDVVMKSLEHRLAKESYLSELSVPNLIPLVGEDKAAAFFQRMFSNSTVPVSVPQGEKTQTLARKLALEMIDQLKVPQWQLACSMDGGPLFEALEKKFGKTDSDTNQTGDSVLDALLSRQKLSRNATDSSYTEAKIYYLTYLISQNRTQEAMALAQKVTGNDYFFLPEEAFNQMAHAGYAKPLHDFLHDLLSQNPGLPFWDEYISLSANVGETDKMLDLARKSAARQDLTAKQRAEIQKNLYSALLAADHVEEGVAEMRQILSQSPSRRDSEFDYRAESEPQLALKLAEIGKLLQNTNWIEEGIRLTRSKIAENEKANGGSTYVWVTSLASFLSDLGRGPEAEAVLSDALSKASAQTDPEQLYGGGGASRNYLSALVSLYYRAGRYADVLLLLDQAPGWAASDLADLRDTYVDYEHQHEDSLEDSVRHEVAASLLELGRKDEAEKIANAILDQNGGYDPAYEVLLKSGDPEVTKRLDELFARDQFEERPLIWKAILLQREGKLEEAEVDARRAISIDPSDGEQGPGRRMRAYAVLADIRKARGDEKEADFFRGAVEAIRLSETADSYYAAGLLKQAVGMYEDSLVKFEGAYCIQSRLALRLSELGKHEEAAEHFKRAYELMPDSFGRVESHCFGCEGAFKGAQAQSIADKVFTALTKTDPNKPQVHYLLGFLREEQGNYAEALQHYRDAVRLDPDYLNAWKHIESVGKEYYLSAADLDSVTLNGIRLDPLGRHGGWVGIGEVTDLRALWNAAAAADKLGPQLAKTLYPLPASKVEMEKQANRDNGRYARARAMMEEEDYHPSARPAQAILENDIIKEVIGIFVGGYGVID